MDFLEKDLEEILYSTPQELIINNGLRCFSYSKIYIQFRISAYGIIDLLTIEYKNNTFYIKVYELKNNKIDTEAFLQILGYIKGVYTAYNEIIGRYNNKREVNIQGILIGRKIDTSTNICFLPLITPVVHIYTYNYEFNGILFTKVRNDYCNTTYAGFNEDTLEFNSIRDFLNQMSNG